MKSGEGKSQWIKFDDDAWHAAVEKRCHSGDSRDSREKTMCGIHVLTLVARKDANSECNLRI